MKHYVVKFDVVVIVAADNHLMAVNNAKEKLSDIDGIESIQDTDVYTLGKLLRMAQQNFTELRKIEREE